MRHLLLKPSACGLMALVIVAGLVAASAAAGKREIPVAAELAFCNGQQVAAVDGVLHLNATDCVLNLQILWVRGMRSAYLEFSSDGGSTWAPTPFDRPFPVVDVGLVAGIAIGTCDEGLPSGTYLFRAHGFKSRNERGDLFSDAFPDGVSFVCP